MGWSLQLFGGLALSVFFPEATLPEDRIHVPLVRQQTDYSCGAAALLSVLRYWKAYKGTEASLYEKLGTHPHHGTDARALFRAAKELGLRGEMRERTRREDLAAALRKKQTVIVDFQAWTNEPEIPYSEQWEDGHYAVVVAMDAGFVYLMDPVIEDGYGFLSFEDFSRRWHDYEEDNKGVWRNHGLALFLSGESHTNDFDVGEIVPIE